MRFRKRICCEKCQNYWTCEDKWYRGENNKESLCCELCNSYDSCVGIKKRTSKNGIAEV